MLPTSGHPAEISAGAEKRKGCGAYHKEAGNCFALHSVLREFLKSDPVVTYGQAFSADSSAHPSASAGHASHKDTAMKGKSWILKPE
ncbi:MAG: hypothetical protein WBE37_26835 [Bryobacteraceae bacterium]